MYLLLLVFGALLAAAGIVLAASGVSVHDRLVDTTVVTPGLVAVVGGLLLIGLGLALRVLQRIEKALAVRPMPRATRPGEPVAPAVQDGPDKPVRLPFPPKIAPQTHPVIAAPALPSPAAQEMPPAAQEMPPAAQEMPPATQEMPPAEPMDNLTTIARQENAKLMEGVEMPSLPKSAIPFAAARAEEASPGRQTNGSAPPPTPRFDLGVRSAREPARAQSTAFDTVWPKRQKPSRPAAPKSSPPSANAGRRTDEAIAAGHPVKSTAPAVTVLKSGVVDGMGYTLYSDGSIAAELPQGTVRFRSITELRNHLERAS